MKNEIVLFGDLNAEVGNVTADWVVGFFGMPGINEVGERMVQLGVDLIVGDTQFKKKDIPGKDLKSG